MHTRRERLALSGWEHILGRHCTGVTARELRKLGRGSRVGTVTSYGRHLEAHRVAGHHRIARYLHTRMGHSRQIHSMSLALLRHVLRDSSG
jgi:hypothetical protein